MFVTSPVLADTVEEAQARAEVARTPDPVKIEVALAHMSAVTEIDFSTLDLDAPSATCRPTATARPSPSSSGTAARSARRRSGG